MSLKRNFAWSHPFNMGFLGGASDKESACQCKRFKRGRINPWIGKILWGRKWHPTPVFLPEKFQGQRSLVGCCSAAVHGVPKNWTRLSN